MSGAAEIPHKSHLSEIYTDPKPQFARYRNLLTKFAELYGPQHVSPDLLVRSPGRVNIMGDHIDYCLFPCLPMAVENDMVIVASVTNDARVEIANCDSSFKSESFDLTVSPDKLSEPIVNIDATITDWVNYFKCGLLVGDDFLKKNNAKRGVGLRILIDGNVPAASGLSSSAAFVVCSTLITLLANGYTDINKSLLTKLSITCEQHLGLNSGGLDQSASIYGQKGYILYVSFYPQLTAQDYSFPPLDPNIAFVISNSLVVSNKRDTGPVNYNLRVVESTLSALLLAKKLGFSLPPHGNLQAGTFRDVLDIYFQDKSDLKFGDDVEDSREKLAKFVELTETLFDHKQDGYTTEQVSEELGVPVEELQKRYMTTYPVRYKTLQLYKRAKHVYAESKRVLEFLTILKDATANKASSQQVFTQLGAIMNASQHSLATDMGNSCPELDEICEIALANGSYGSRVTGAGWGGCAVHLVSAPDAPKLIAALTEKYYKKHHPNITDAELAEALLVSEPASGTTIIENVSLD